MKARLDKIKTGRVERKTKRKKRQNQKQQKHRFERSSSYSINHEQAKKNGERDTKHSRDRKVMRWGGNPNNLLFCLNTGKLEVTKDFFLEEIVNHFACKRNYFVLQSETAIFAC